MKRCLPILIFVLAVFLVTGCTKSGKVADAAVAAAPIPDPYTLEGERSFLDGYEPRNVDCSVNVVVEIPTGTTEEWEVSKPEGQLKWEFREGKPRVVKYLGPAPGAVVGPTPRRQWLPWLGDVTPRP